MPRSYVKKRIKKQNNTQKNNKWGGAGREGVEITAKHFANFVGNRSKDTFNREIKKEDLNITHLSKIFDIINKPTPIRNYSNYVRYVCEPRQVYIKKHAYNTTSEKSRRRRQPITPCKEGLISINGFILNETIPKLILTFNESGYSVVFHSDNFNFFTEKIVEPSSEIELENVVDAAALKPGNRPASVNDDGDAINENETETEEDLKKIPPSSRLEGRIEEKSSLTTHPSRPSLIPDYRRFFEKKTTPRPRGHSPSPIRAPSPRGARPPRGERASASLPRPSTAPAPPSATPLAPASLTGAKPLSNTNPTAGRRPPPPPAPSPPPSSGRGRGRGRGRGNEPGRGRGRGNESGRFEKPNIGTNV
jgi:hypothetical protein